MAQHLNFQNKIVSGGRFVPLEGDNISLRQKVSRLSQAITSVNLGNQIAGITKITSDNVVTVAEKPSLLKEWEYIKEAYNMTVSAVEEMGLESTEQFHNFQVSYEKLESVMESIFADMNTDTILTQDVGTIISEYNQKAISLNSFLTGTSNSLLRELSKYSLDVEVPYSVETNSDLTIKAVIRCFNEETGQDAEMTEEQKEPYKIGDVWPMLYIWNISGTKNDEMLMDTNRGKPSITIPANYFSGESISVSFSSVLSF